MSPTRAMAAFFRLRPDAAQLEPLIDDQTLEGPASWRSMTARFVGGRLSRPLARAVEGRRIAHA